MAIVRSVGDAALATGGRALGAWDAEGWSRVTKMVGESWGSAALGTAMAGVGLSTNLKAFRAMGLKPLFVGRASAILVGVLALAPRCHRRPSPLRRK